MNDFSLDAKFSGFLYGTWKYGMGSGPYLRQPFWRSYTEFYNLWRLLSQKYALVLPFPKERSVVCKINWSNGVISRKKVLEDFLKSCLQIDGIWSDKDWNCFLNPLKLPVDYYIYDDCVQLGLIEWSLNVTVYRVRIDGGEYAVKSIGFENCFYPQVLNEIAIHQKLDYRHCLKFQGYKIQTRLGHQPIASRHRLDLVLEVAKQSLLQALEQDSYHNGFPEHMARDCFYQIMLGVLYLHHHGICHRDLKPQNILLMEDWSVKICDYGFAHYQGRCSITINQKGPWRQFQTLLPQPSLPIASCGTLFYAAPEVLMGHEYDGQQSDLYSCGKILFRLLVGARPLNETTIHSLSPQSLDLINRLVEDDPQNRATIRDVFDHPWLKPVTKESDLVHIFQSKLKHPSSITESQGYRSQTESQGYRSQTESQGYRSQTGSSPSYPKQGTAYATGSDPPRGGGAPLRGGYGAAYAAGGAPPGAIPGDVIYEMGKYEKMNRVERQIFLARM